MIGNVKAYLDNNWKNDNRITGWHDIRVVDTEKHHVILFGISTKKGMTKIENLELRKELEESIQNKYNDFDVNIRTSPIHRY